MQVSDTSKLVALSDSGFTLEHTAEDVRDFKVEDAKGEEIGKVYDLMIDETHKKVRFLVIASGGFLGMGKDKFLLPVDAVNAIKDDLVTVDRTREHVAGSPVYDPEIVVPAQPYLNDVYAYYGFNPYWGAGYIYPPYPYIAGGPNTMV